LEKTPGLGFPDSEINEKSTDAGSNPKDNCKNNHFPQVAIQPGSGVDTAITKRPRLVVGHWGSLYSLSNVREKEKALHGLK
jgi:hypothetical protein